MMKSNVKGFIKVLSSNLLLVFLGIAQSFVLPKILGPSEYGKWSVFLLYTGYAGLFSLGFCDGLLLKYAGLKYAELDRKKFKGYYVTHFVFLLLCLLIYISILILFHVDNLLIYIFIGIASLFSCQRDFFESINVMTNRMGQYSIGHIIEKVILLAGILLCLIFSIKEAVYVAGFAVLGWALTIVYNFCACREISLNKEWAFFEEKKEYFEICKRGIFITLTSIGVALLTGFGKTFVEWQLGDEQLGYYSFVFSLSALFATMFNALSTVFFPALKKKDKEDSRIFLNDFSFVISIIGVLLILFYFPLYLFINTLFNQYRESLCCLFILIPIVVVQGKNNCIYSTLYKIYGYERQLLYNLIFSVGCCCIFTILLFFFQKTIVSVAIATYIGVCARYFFNHVFFKIKTKDQRFDFFWQDFLVQIVFIFLVLLFDFGLCSFIGTAIIVILYVSLNLKRILLCFKKMLSNLRKE